MVPFIVSVLGLKKSGKTTVVEGIVAELRCRGYSVGTVKSMVHSSFTFDSKGKDTKRHAEAGAEFVIALSKGELLYLEPGKHERERIASLSRLFPPGIQFVVAEGLEEPFSPGCQVIALRETGDLKETIRVRGADPGMIVAISGLVASRDPRFEAWNAYDIMGEGRGDLVDLILSAAGSPSPAGTPAGPLRADPNWRPGILPPGEYPPIPDVLEEGGSHR